MFHCGCYESPMTSIMEKLLKKIRKKDTILHSSFRSQVLCTNYQECRDTQPRGTEQATVELETSARISPKFLLSNP